MIISIASGVVDSMFGKSQEPIKAVIVSRNEMWEERSIIPEVFKMDTTSNFAEKYTYETALGDFEIVGENGNYPEGEFQEGYDKVIYPEEFKKRFKISQTLVEDGKAGSFGKQEGMKLTDAWWRTRERFGAKMFTKGNATSMDFGGKTGLDISCADGKALFATDHPSITGGDDQSNLYNLEYSYENLSTVETAMQNFTDDNGNELNIMPNQIVIENDARLKARVFETLGADYKPGTTDNDSSFHFGRWNIVVWPYLGKPTGITSGKAWWFIMDTVWNETYNGAVWLDRIDLTISSYIDENTDANIWKGRGRYGAGFNDWRAFLACIPGTGTTA